MSNEDELGNDLEDALERTRELIERTGDDVVDDIDDTDDDGRRVLGFACQHGNNGYTVYTRPENEFFTVQFEYSVLGDYIRQQLESDFEDLIDEGQEQPTVEIDPEDEEEFEQQIESARTELRNELRAIDESQAFELLFKLSQQIVSPNTAHQIETTEDGRVTGFRVQKKVYPYRDDFDIKEVGDAIQAVISQGIPGRMFIQMAYGFRAGAVDSGEAGDIEDDRTFH